MPLPLVLSLNDTGTILDALSVIWNLDSAVTASLLLLLLIPD